MCEDKYIYQEFKTEETKKKAVSYLNTSKDEDFYDLTAEYFIHGIVFIKIFPTILNKSFKFCYIPNLMKIRIYFSCTKTKGISKCQKL